jgi:RNA polymerase sigma-70 factor (ECF subfamily)
LKDRSSPIERSNRQWLDELRGGAQDTALADLRDLLVHGLRHALVGRSNVDEQSLDDFAQEALLKIVTNLDSFRGESRFITWAQKIAVRVAFTELRRHRWREVSLDSMTGFPDTAFIPLILADPSPGPEQQVARQSALDSIEGLMSEALTDRQHRAMQAVLEGVPLEDVARTMGTNRNALYKLLFDARRRLRDVTAARELSSRDVLSAVGR